MLKILIRFAKVADLSRVSYITRLAYKIPFQEGAIVTRPHESRNIKEKFLNKEFFVIVAEHDKKIIGAVKYKFDKNKDIYLYQLAVLKTYRNKGIGLLLIKEIERVAKREKCKKILLDFAQEKKLAEFYKELGFKIDKIQKHHDHHDVYMSKLVL